MEKSKLFESNPAIVKANVEYQVGMQRFLNGEITIEERQKYQETVFEVCYNDGLVWNISIDI